MLICHAPGGGGGGGGGGGSRRMISGEKLMSNTLVCSRTSPGLLKTSPKNLLHPPLNSRSSPIIMSYRLLWPM